MRKSLLAAYDRLSLPHVSLFLILLAAFLLRIRGLDVPSMWGDELFAPIMASKPLSYLTHWVWVEDVHPPLFYFFLKMVLAASDSDFALRLPSVIFAMLTLFLLFKVVKERCGDACALLTTAVFSISAAHIYLSRVVRFYSFTLFLVILALFALQRFHQSRDDKYLRLGVFSLAAMLLAEFTSLMPILAIYLLFTVSILSRPGRLPAMRRLLLTSAAYFALPLVFLVLTSIQRKGFSYLASPESAALNYFKALFWLMHGELTRTPSEGLPFFPWLVAVAALAGGVRLAFRDRGALFVCLSFFLCSLAFILFVRPGYSLAFWHLFFLLPVMSFLIASALQIFTPPARQPFAAALLCLLGAALYLGPGADMFYAPFSYGSDARELGRAVASELEPGSAVMIDDNNYDNVNWYADRFCLTNRLVEQNPNANADRVVLNVFTAGDGAIGHLADEEHPLSGRARVIEDKFLGVNRLMKFSIPRSPVMNLDIAGDKLELGAAPEDFYAHFSHAKDVMISPYWGLAVVPTKNEEWAELGYVFENPDRTPYVLINGTLRYKIEGKGDAFVARYRFDDEPEVELVNDAGPARGTAFLPDDPQMEKAFTLKRAAPFKRLAIDIRLYCGFETPHFPTSNLTNVAFKKLIVSARRYGADLMDESAFDPGFEFDGIRGVEKDGPNSWRWAVGPVSRISFTLSKPQKVRLAFGLNSPFEGQTCVVTANGEKVLQSDSIPRHEWMKGRWDGSVEFEGREGANTVEFAFGKINHVTDSFSETDATPYTAAITVLRIERAEDGAPLSP